MQFNSRARDDAAWQAPCEGASAANAWSGWTEQRGQGQKGACSAHLNLKRFGYSRDLQLSSSDKPALHFAQAARGAGLGFQVLL
ncbi:MAG: hypothetical protein P8Y42_01905 [Exilibacterium sp.]